MIKVTKKVEYALMTLNYLKDSQEPVSVKKISDDLNLPFDTTSQVLQVLAKSEITRSFKGSKGGYKLISDLSKLTMFKLSELVEKKKFYKNCEDQDCQHVSYCQIKSPINYLYQEVSKLFMDMKVSELLQY